jgi:type II secretory pathway component PulF
VIGHTVATNRRRRGQLVLGYLEQAVRLNLPLPRLLEAAARSERGALQRRLERLRRSLAMGHPVGQCLLDVPEVPLRAAAIVSAAERVGRLGDALRRLVRRGQSQPSDDGVHRLYLGAYPSAVAATILVVTGMFFVFVLPRFEAIFADYGIILPPITIWTVTAARYFGGLAIVIGAIPLALVLGASLGRILPRLGPRGPLLPSFTDPIAWRMPLLHGLLRDKGLADALDIAADGLEVATPADVAIEHAAGLRINTVLANRLADWAARIRTGQALGQAAEDAGLPPLVSGLLGSMHGGDDAAATMRFLARHYAWRLQRTLIVLRAAAVPAMVLVLGALVLIVAVAIFTPLQQLIEVSMPYQGVL